MLNEKKVTKIAEYYKKVTIAISVRLFNNILSNEGENTMIMDELNDFTGEMINNFTEIFMDYIGKLEGEPTEKDIEPTKNIVRSSLLKLSAKTDLSPDEELVAYCCQEIVALIFYTNEIDQKDD